MGKTVVNHPPVITIFIGGMFTIPSHGWFMTLFYPHYHIKQPSKADPGEISGVRSWISSCNISSTEDVAQIDGKNPAFFPGKISPVYPIGSMYGIYANIGDILMVNVTIYTIHGSYGYPKNCCFYPKTPNPNSLNLKIQR